jgi:HK97 gp10 family phage protein
MPGTLRGAVHIWRKRLTQYAVTYYVGVRGLSKKASRQFKSNTDRKGKALKGSDNPRDPYYWMWVELGTSKMAARPFLRPAFEAKKVEAVHVALREGQKFVRKTAAKFKRIRK